MLPRWQALPGVQAAPAVQATHAPPPQTWFAPQLVPLESAEPTSTHCSLPEAQLVWPAWQGKPGGVHDRPALHAPQIPPWQARSEPQDVPSAMAPPVSEQVETPVAQLVAPAWQGFAAGHAWPE